MIKVLIERHIAPTLEAPYEEQVRDVLQATVAARGFIAGENLRDARDPNHCFLISLWQSAADWQSWETSEERRSMMESLYPMMDREEKVTLLEHN